MVVSIVDTVVALLAGLAIFPIVFANGLEPGAGPGLIFQTLLVAFSQMPLGGLLVALYVGWFMSRQALANELSLSDGQFRVWYSVLKYVTPLAVLAVFVYNLL